MAESRPSYDPQALLNAQPVMVAVIDPASYTIQFQNETALEKLGDLSGRKCYETIAGCASPCAFCQMPEAVRTGKITVNDVVLPSDRHLLVQWSKAMTSDGRLHVIEVITDVTERKRTEEAARKAEKMEALGRLAGGVAHDISNLLTVLMGASEHISSHLVDRASLDPIQRMQSALERTAELTRRLVAFSHHQVLQPTVLDLNAALKDLVSHIASLATGRIEIEWRLHGEALPILFDALQFKHIISTLVSNAHDAMPTGGGLTISTGTATVGEDLAHEHNVQSGEFVLFSVQDTGGGIPAERLAHLFEPFYGRAGETMGRGLGLASVYGLIRQSGGFIQVASQYGVGTSFSVSLPRADPSLSTQGSMVPVVASSAVRETILLVEDDGDVRLAVSDMLKVAGYQVEEACDGVEALQRLRAMTSPPHLVMTDIMMPRMTGPQLAAQLQTLHPDVRVLYMSGYSDHMLHPQDGRRPAFIAKPFSSRELTRAIQGALAT
ncbi:MAG TPA: ATP-binding protein [Nitrospira sp.]|nr:ATP-binding protein [Nitrospira sp.]